MTSTQQLPLGIVPEETTILKPVETVGSYFTDQQGGHWASIFCSGGLVCSDCGSTFYAGYCRAKLSEIERLSCGCRVKAVYPKRRRGRTS